MMAFPRREEYEQLLYELPERYRDVVASSSLRLYSNSPTTCLIRGSLIFRNGMELRIFEFLDLLRGKLLSYSYTLLNGEERLRWYDPQPHPENAELAATFPHHVHTPPDIKHHRQPAPNISFEHPNLPALIEECSMLGSQ